jgi:uncharacterized oligopeptide transporter (OPT) family protein
MKTTRYKSYKTFTGFSSQTVYQGNLLALQLSIIMFSGLFIAWGASTFMNVYMEKPSCSPAKSL